MPTGYEVSMYRDISVAAQELGYIAKHLERVADEIKQLRELFELVASNMPAQS